MKRKLITVLTALALMLAMLPGVQGAYAENPTTTLLISANCEFTVTNAEGQYFTWDKGVVKGTMKVYMQRMIIMGQSQVQVVVDTSPSYTCVGSKTKTNIFGIFSGKPISRVIAQHSDSITIGTENGVGYIRANGKGLDYALMLGLYNNGEGNTIFRGKSIGDVEERDEPGGVILTGADGITSLKKRDVSLNQESLDFIPYADSVVFSGFEKKPFKAKGAVLLKDKENSAISNVRSHRIADDTIMLTWTKVKGASGYIVYRYDIQKKSYEKVKTIKSQGYTMFADRHLQLDTAYRYEVRPYSVVNGKKKAGKASYYVSAATLSQTIGNATGITSSEKTIKGAAGTKTDMKAHVTAAPGLTLFDSSVRWFAKNKKIASITKGGRLTLKAKGKTYVWGKTHKGKNVTVRVTVTKGERTKALK